MATIAAHTTVAPDQWAEGERVQAITWGVFRFQWNGLLIDEGLTQVSNRREGTLIDPATGVVTLTIEADVEPRP